MEETILTTVNSMFCPTDFRFWDDMVKANPILTLVFEDEESRVYYASSDIGYVMVEVCFMTLSFRVIPEQLLPAKIRKVLQEPKHEETKKNPIDRLNPGGREIIW